MGAEEQEVKRGQQGPIKETAGDNSNTTEVKNEASVALKMLINVLSKVHMIH